jgi:SNF2 family DNA or RNA helicase
MNGILADEMGLGKTVQAIAMICHLYETTMVHTPVLVVGPMSTLGNWKREFAKFAPLVREITL